MLKKVFSLVLIMLLLTGCTPTLPEILQNPEEDSSETFTVSGNTESVDAPMDVVLPSAFFANENMEEFDPEEYAEKMGYEAAVLNDDGSVTVTMSPEKYDSMLQSLEQDIVDLINRYLRNTDYIKTITANEDYSQFTVTVDKAGYQATFDTTPSSLLLSAALYHMLVPGEAELTVEIIDAETQEILTTATY